MCAAWVSDLALRSSVHPAACRRTWQYAVNAVLYRLRGERQGAVLWADAAARVALRKRYVALYRLFLERKQLERASATARAAAVRARTPGPGLPASRGAVATPASPAVLLCGSCHGEHPWSGPSPDTCSPSPARRPPRQTSSCCHWSGDCRWMRF